MTTNPERGGSGPDDPPLSSQASLQHAASIDYRAEVVRKGIHLFSLSIPVIYAFITRELALWILIPLTATALAIEAGRYWSPAFADVFYRVFRPIMRRHEQDNENKRLNGATYVLLSAVLCVAVFPKLITITAFAILIISDSTSALIGRRFGKRPFFRKSREGAIAFFVSALVVVLVTPKSEGLPWEYAIGIAGALVGTIVEAASRIDDNLAIPVSVGAVMWALYALFLPGLDLSGPIPLF